VVEIISLTFAKFSWSLFMLDSCFSHVMILCTIQGSPKVHLFFLRLLVPRNYEKRDFFVKMVKLTNMLVEPKA
jgi:hypothetical protein